MTEDDISGFAQRHIFLRGKEYFRDGRVKCLEFKNGVLFASVLGSESLPYQVKVYIRDRKSFHSECTCAYDWGTVCKHAVAALLAASVKSAGLNPAGTSGRQNVLSKPSLLFPRDSRSLTPPVIRFTLPTRNNFGISSKGIKVTTTIIHGGQSSELYNTAQLFDPRDYYYGRNSDFPSFDEFNDTQRHCLRLIHSFRDAYSSESRLQPYELALLLRESGGEGVEFFEGRYKQLQVRRGKPVPLVVEVASGSKDKLQAFLFARHPDAPDSPMHGHLVEGRPCWFINFDGGSIFPFADVFDEDILNNVFSINNVVEWPKARMPEFIHSVLGRIKGHARISFRDKDLEHIRFEEASPAVQLYLDGSIKRLTIDVRFIYNGQVFALPDLIYAAAYLPVDGHTLWLKRDIAGERRVIAFLCDECGFYLDGEHHLATTDADAIARFVFEQLPLITGKYDVFCAPDFEKRFKARSFLKPRISFGADDLDWFYFDVSYTAQGIEQEFSAEEIRRQLLKGKNYIQLKSGDVIPIAREEFDKAERLAEEFDGKTKSLPVFHVPFLLEEAGRQKLDVALTGRFGEIHERFKRFRSIKTVKPPRQLKNILRDYQRKGLDWLEFLRDFRLGGILADEMGLGKTLQVLALIKTQVEAGERLPHLVVCPTTLVWNWQAEIKKFLPDLKVLIPQGMERRQQIETSNDYHVVITSYALLRRDAQLYEKFPFNYVILDEAQNIKNRHTVNARMSKQLKSRHRLVLTGTPLENSVADLWSIFDFLMPGFLGGYERFKSRYEVPVLKDQNKEALDTLARKINPFVLRRLKKDVIKELPEKIEQISWCEMEPSQCKTYEQMLALGRREVLGAYQAQGFHKSRMKILTVLLRLRQICCHPELAHVKLGHRLAVSAKLNLLKEILQEAVSGGHNILIFSQFVTMLSIIAEYLKKEKILFEYMDGSTKDRPGAVERFNTADDVKIFLLSLKVGGVGLNLTKADTVILYEPWWNPAVEDQAVDRAHRIGQKSAVTAYKLICKGTIEEKILELQKRKKNLIDSLVVSEEGIAKKLGWEDIKFLLDL